MNQAVLTLTVQYSHSYSITGTTWELHIDTGYIVASSAVLSWQVLEVQTSKYYAAPSNIGSQPIRRWTHYPNFGKWISWSLDFTAVHLTTVGSWQSLHTYVAQYWTVLEDGNIQLSSKDLNLNSPSDSKFSKAWTIVPHAAWQCSFGASSCSFKLQFRYFNL